VYLGNNTGGTYKIEAKAKGAMISNCGDITVTFTDLLGILEIVGCRNVTVRGAGMVPTVQIDSSDQTAVYLEENTIKTTKFFSSKSTSSQIFRPLKTFLTTKFQEHSLPQQFFSHFKNGKLETMVASDKMKKNVITQTKKIIENYGREVTNAVKVKPEATQTVIIRHNQGGAFEIESKAKNVIIRNCQNIVVTFVDIVDTLEIIACQKITVQGSGVVPTVQIDASDRTSVYFSAEAIKTTEIISTKSSSTNLYSPNPNTDYDDCIEHALPEQFCSSFNSTKESFDSEVVIIGKDYNQN